MNVKGKDLARLRALLGSGGGGNAPSGEISITENGIFDVAPFASANVNVPTGGGDDTLDKLISGEITEITSNVTKIRNYAFHYCSNLTTVDFPLVTSIGTNAFHSCSNLTTVDFPLATSVENTAFGSCSSLTTADFPLATSVKNYAFTSCYSLTALILRSEKMATLSNTNAFNNCYHIRGTVNSTYNPEGLKDGYIYVPRALVDSYKTASNWSTFETQFRILEDFTVDGTITGELDPNKI